MNEDTMITNTDAVQSEEPVDSLVVRNMALEEAAKRVEAQFGLGTVADDIRSMKVNIASAEDMGIYRAIADNYAAPQPSQPVEADEPCPDCHDGECYVDGSENCAAKVVAVPNAERTAFEAWAASEGFDLVRHGDETYATQECHDAWQGWQARGASPQAAGTQPAPEPVAWRHSHTLCLYETEADVPLADGDEWAVPLYLAAQPASGGDDDHSN